MSFLETQPILCPYCSSRIDIVVDYSMAHQEYVEDCQTCCRPILLRINISSEQEVDIDARQENE